MYEFSFAGYKSHVKVCLDFFEKQTVETCWRFNKWTRGFSLVSTFL